ncbi:hypothetical protein ANN_27844 [Periplaneta americana]|uniref:HTH psq-type domain-containing protein n=1 Tax=Periplaneta americana TaxID=6978 RepID=A0ABQ8RVE6_PERAM|nr:hypothetical protein ANN_27844 [Periplaneta americana]
MPRVYKRDPNAKWYSPVSRDIIDKAKEAVHKGLSIRSASKQFAIPYTVLQRHLKNANVKNRGGQTALSEDEEALLVEKLVLCAEWDYPIDSFDLRLLVKGFLDRRGKVVKKFNNNLPERDFAELFLKRCKDQLSVRMCQNIKRSRAGVTTSAVNEYFDNLENTLAGVPPENIINFDETNLQDDPGKKKVMSKRGVKYPECVMNHSKSSTSVMFAASGSGVLLPCFVVYRSNHLYASWTEGAPRGTRFNRTKSGWFDSCCFDDWIRTIVIPYLKPLEGSDDINDDDSGVSRSEPEVDVDTPDSGEDEIASDSNEECAIVNCNGQMWWVPRLLSQEQTNSRQEVSQRHLSRYEEEGDDFLNRIVTSDETWVHHYTPESKRSSMLWRKRGAAGPVKAKTRLLLERSLLLFFGTLKEFF